MSTRVVVSISYKDTSHDKVDVALTKLKCPATFISTRQLLASRNTVSCLKCNEPLSVARRFSNEDPLLLATAP
jgi:hypothetical protein